MLGPLISKVILLIHFLYRGGNNVWIASNVVPLGCYSPFDIAYTVSQTEDPQKIGFSSCMSCSTSFVLVRGSQCICIETHDVNKLVLISESYCDIRCSDGVSEDADPLYCGGNLGGNLYCNKMSLDSCQSVDVNKSVVDLYRHFDEDQPVETCLHYGCAGRPDFFNPVNMTLSEYFPKLNPRDCITYCSFERTSYALAGWMSHTSMSNRYLYPSCACSNVTRPMNPAGPPCRNGTCWPTNPDEYSIVFDDSDKALWCGNQDADHDNWSVYCTTGVLKGESDNTLHCAPYQEAAVVNYTSLDTCVTTTSWTQKMTSETIPTTEKPNKGCLKTSNKKEKTFKEGEWVGLQCQDKCDYEPCCLCGPCGNTTSCYYKGSCYNIGSESSDHSNVDDIDQWRAVVATKCNNQYPGGHLVAVETQIEQQYLSSLLSVASEDKPSVMTGGVMVEEEVQYWDLSNDEFNPIEDVDSWGVSVYVSEECSEDLPCYLILSHDEAKDGYDAWRYTRCYDSRYYICEYAEIVTTTTATTSTSTTPVTESSETTEPTTTTTSTTTMNTTRPSDWTSTENETSDTETTSEPPDIDTTTRSDSQTTARGDSQTTTEEWKELPENCPCVQTDIYHFQWVIQPNEVQVQPCRSGAVGNAIWACDYIDGYGCQLRTEQPDYSGCRSQELENISAEVETANTTVDLYRLWLALQQFTTQNDTYFGHEIDSILNVILELLDQQDMTVNGTDNHLEFQINTTQTGTYIIDDLISHDTQWNQLSNQENKSQSAVFLLGVAEEMSFRLVNVAELDGRSLRCETRLENVTISSSYWNGDETFIRDCDLNDYGRNLNQTKITDTNSVAKSELFRRFPLTDLVPGSSYLLLPEGALVANRTHKAAGVLISQNILQQLLPGQNNVAGVNKQVDSPIISYSLKLTDADDWNIDEMPDGDFVRLVFRHGITAKDPPVRTLHRSLKPGETASAVIGSSFCVFMSYNVSSQGSNGQSWIWDGRGCQLESTNRTHTVCRCNHLTGFASLMDFHDYTGESRPLEITSLVCSTASAICLAITFIVLTALRSIKTDRTIITQNLCIFLMLSHILALTTLNRNYFDLDDATCAAMGVLLHFSLLVSFMWMGIEGLRLCRMVVYVFNLDDWTVYYVLVSYIAPFLIVSITVLTAHISADIISTYAGDETCWLNGENYKWSFAGPVAVIILVNLVFVVIAVRSSWNLKQNTDRKLEEKVRNAAALALSLTCLLGISWLTGFFLLAETQVFAYIFTITNGLQGVTIMLFRCVLNDEVSNAIKERWRRHQTTSVGRWSSMATQNTSSQRRRSVSDIHGRMKASMKLAQANSQLSILSGSTKTTDMTDIRVINPLSQQGNRHRNNIRTFSGTEFSDEFSSEISESRSSVASINSSYRHHPGRRVFERGARDSRRVSFFVENQESTNSRLQNEGPDEVDQSTDTSAKVWGSKQINDSSMFYQQSPSTFF